MSATSECFGGMCDCGGDLEQLQRADRDMKVRLRGRLEDANPGELYYALYELVDVVPDLVDSALTEAGVK